MDRTLSFQRQPGRFSNSMKTKFPAAAAMAVAEELQAMLASAPSKALCRSPESRGVTGCLRSPNPTKPRSSWTSMTRGRPVAPVKSFTTAPKPTPTASTLPQAGTPRTHLQPLWKVRQNHNMKTLEQATSRELEIKQVRRRIGLADAEILRITTDVLPGMMKKQSARRKELERQEALARSTKLSDRRHERYDC